MRHAIQKLLHWIRSVLGRPISSIIYTNLFSFFVGITLGTIWISAALLNAPLATTLVKIDLLQALGFLLAWSLFLISTTYRIVHDSRDTNERLDNIHRVLRENSLTPEQVMDKSYQVLISEVGRLNEENKQLHQENAELRRATQTEQESF